MNSNSNNSKNKWMNKQNRNGKRKENNKTKTNERGRSVNNVCKIYTKSRKVLTYCVTKDFLPVWVHRCKYVPVICSFRASCSQWPRIYAADGPLFSVFCYFDISTFRRHTSTIRKRYVVTATRKLSLYKNQCSSNIFFLFFFWWETSANTLTSVYLFRIELEHIEQKRQHQKKKQFYIYLCIWSARRDKA